MDQEDQRERVVSLFREMTKGSQQVAEKAKKRRRMAGTTIIDSTIVVCSEPRCIERVIAQLLGKKQRATDKG